MDSVSGAYSDARFEYNYWISFFCSSDDPSFAFFFIFFPVMYAVVGVYPNAGVLPRNSLRSMNNAIPAPATAPISAMGQIMTAMPRPKGNAIGRRSPKRMGMEIAVRPDSRPFLRE